MLEYSVLNNYRRERLVSLVLRSDDSLPFHKEENVSDVKMEIGKRKCQLLTCAGCVVVGITAATSVTLLVPRISPSLQA